MMLRTGIYFFNQMNTSFEALVASCAWLYKFDFSLWWNVFKIRLALIKGWPRRPWASRARLKDSQNVKRWTRMDHTTMWQKKRRARSVKRLNSKKEIANEKMLRGIPWFPEDKFHPKPTFLPSCINNKHLLDRVSVATTSTKDNMHPLVKSFRTYISSIQSIIVYAHRPSFRCLLPLSMPLRLRIYPECHRLSPSVR